MSFKYMPRTQEDVARRSKQASGAYDSFLRVGAYKPRVGENQIRILPWLNGDRSDAREQYEKWGGKDGAHWGIDILIHYNVGGDNGTYLCLKMRGEPCPVCEARLEAEGKEREKLQATAKILCWLLDRNDTTGNPPQPWAMPLKFSKGVSKASQIKGDGGWLAIDLPDEGYDIFFDKTGEGLKTQYDRIEASRDSTPLSTRQDQQNAWLDYVDENFLPDLLQYYDYDHIASVLFGNSGAQGEASDSGARPSNRRREEAPKERVETVRRGRPDPAPAEHQPAQRVVQTITSTVRPGDEEPPWEEGKSIKETFPAQESQEGQPAAQRPSASAQKPLDDNRSASGARERLAQFHERRRRG